MTAKILRTAVFVCILLAVLAAVCFAVMKSDGQNDGDFQIFEEEVNTLEGVSMEITFSSPTFAKMTILNTTDLDIIYGMDYDLQVLRKGRWYSLPYLIDNWAIQAVAFTTQKNVPSEWGVDWTVFHGALTEGTYRVVKTVRESGEEAYYIAAEFEIGED